MHVRETTDEVETAEGFIKDAEQCKLLLSSLHDSAAVRDLAQCPVQQKLAEISANLETFLASHIANSVDSMMKIARERCPTLLAAESKSLQELGKLTDTKSKIPPEFVKTLVYDTLG